MPDWTASIEEFPHGKDFGSVSGFAVRQVKSMFQTRLEMEHTFDVGASPECVHVPGKATIVKFLDSTPLTLLKVGGLQYDYSAGTLYRDTGAAMESVGAKDHGGYANLTAENAHTQYLHKTKATPDEIVDVTVPAAYKLKGLKESAGGYSGAEVLPRALHTFDSGGHDSDIITDISALAKVGRDKLDVTYATVYDGTIGGLSGQEVTIGARAFLPFASECDGVAFYLHPAFSNSPPSDYVAKANFRNPNLFAKSFVLHAWRLA